MTFKFGSRKVLKVGYSLLIPLPAEWARNVKTGKGDSVTIEMMPDQTLRISPVNCMEIKQ